MTSDTPRTDAQEWMTKDASVVVVSTFARQLERELTAARARILDLEARHEDGAGMVTRLQAQFERECADGDRICEALGVGRTEGGSMQVRKMLNVIEALRADAERYRVLREFRVVPLMVTKYKSEPATYLAGTALDAAIDEARVLDAHNRMIDSAVMTARKQA